jgi:hypothetical protein
MEVIVKNNQSLIDVAIEHLGSAFYAVDIALLNGISLTEVLTPGMVLLMPDSTPATSVDTLPTIAPITEPGLLAMLSAHAAIIGGATAGHVRNGGNVTVDGAGRMWVTFPEYVTNWDDIEGVPSSFPPSSHNQDWSTIDNKPTTFAPSEHSHIPQSVSAQNSGTLTLLVPSVVLLSTVLTSSNSMTITPAVPANFDSARCVSVKFSVGATAPNVIFTPPAGVTYEWPDGMLISFSTNKKYSITFVCISATRYDVLWRSW